MSIKDETTLLHNPGCSKSRAALAMMKESGLTFTVREYLVNPLTRQELGELQQLLGSDPIEWVRTGEAEWAASGLGREASAGEILDAMSVSPRLMQRPILISGGSARVGRPPELLRELIVG